MGMLLLIAIELYLLWRIALRTKSRAPSNMLRAGSIVGVLALAPLVPWTVRNLHTLHRFQPLAPRYANQENEFVPMGFNRWVKTWMADYASVEEIYWPVPGDTVDAGKLPNRAFDSEAQRQQTMNCWATTTRRCTSLRSSMPASRHWPRSESAVRLCATTSGCRLCGSRICGYVRGRRRCLPTRAGGSSTTIPNGLALACRGSDQPLLCRRCAGRPGARRGRRSLRWDCYVTSCRAQQLF